MTHGEFLAVIVHELRGAIGAIGAAAHVLEGCDDATGVAAEAREVVVRQSQRLAEIVDDVQELGRLVGSGDAARHDPVDLARLLQRCDIEIAGAGRHATIRTDAAQLEHALARTVREAPSRPRASIEQGKEEAATLFTLEPVGGGFGVQLLRALIERSGAQACLLQGTEGRRFVARLPR